MRPGRGTPRQTVAIKRKNVRSVTEAKTDATRQRRIQKVLDALS